MIVFDKARVILDLLQAPNSINMSGPKRRSRTPASPTTRREKPPSGRRAPDAPVVLVALDAAGNRPLHRQVYDELRDAILAGRLVPDARLPSTRSLADDLGVARNTVTLAFDQLRAEGYIVGQRGGGTRVRCSIPDRLLEVRSRASARKPRPFAPTKRVLHEASAAGVSAAARLSTRAALLVHAAIAIVDRGGTDPVAFRLGVPELDAFPARVWARLTARRWRRGGVYLGDAATAGEPMLREAIASYVTTARGARCHADNVIVVSGTQQALDLTARVLLDPGDSA